MGSRRHCVCQTLTSLHSKSENRPVENIVERNCFAVNELQHTVRPMNLFASPISSSGISRQPFSLEPGPKDPVPPSHCQAAPAYPALVGPYSATAAASLLQ